VRGRDWIEPLLVFGAIAAAIAYASRGRAAEPSAQPAAATYPTAPMPIEWGPGIVPDTALPTVQIPRSAPTVSVPIGVNDRGINPEGP